jgi:hypothetical protein
MQNLNLALQGEGAIIISGIPQTALCLKRTSAKQRIFKKLKPFSSSQN